MGPRVVVVKLGEYGAAMYTADGVFGIPAYPTADVVDPTGAGDTFAGGFVGYVAAHADEEITDELLRRAMAYGTALASFNVEAFGTERMQTLTRRRGQRARRRSSQRVTVFDASPVPLRALGLDARAHTRCRGRAVRGLGVLPCACVKLPSASSHADWTGTRARAARGRSFCEGSQRPQPRSSALLHTPATPRCGPPVPAATARRPPPPRDAR